jgi:subtilisin family serine protease
VHAWSFWLSLSLPLASGGGVTFEQKALHCQYGGGVAAIIYNNQAGYMGGGLSNVTATTIPAIQVLAADGQKLGNAALGQPVSIEVTKGYGYLSGTSMAVPHVTGVIAKIWRAVRVSNWSGLCAPIKGILFASALNPYIDCVRSVY